MDGKPVFRVKICGITSAADAQHAARCGADALGLNFFAGSERCLSQSAAETICQATAASILKVGLFVNSTPEKVCSLFDALNLDLIQLHGDEPPEFLAELTGRAVIKAFRLGPEGTSHIRQYLDGCQRLGCPPTAILVDAFRSGHYGGTGRTLDWGLLARWRDEFPDISLILAGGLTPVNVAEAIETVRPAAVDTASGVETTPGIKDPAKVAAFVAAARRAFGV